MAAWPSMKLLLLKAASCMVSFKRHGPAANPAPGRSAARGSRTPDRCPDPLVVEAEVVGHHEELVGRGELDVAPGVREELGQLGLFGLHPDHLRRQSCRRVLGSVDRRSTGGSTRSAGVRRVRSSPSLGDPLRAEGDVDRTCRASATVALDQGCGPGIERWIGAPAADRRRRCGASPPRRCGHRSRDRGSDARRPGCRSR